MCAIVDANVAHEVFGDARPPAGKRFFDWLAGSRGQLVVGGRLRAELSRDRRFVRWLNSAIRYGRARSMMDDEVEARTDELRRMEVCASDDEHVLALALVSGARLLYTNDAALITDFKNRAIVAEPRGRDRGARRGPVRPAPRPACVGLLVRDRTLATTVLHFRILIKRDLPRLLPAS